MKLRERYKRLSLVNKIAVWGLAVAVLAYLPVPFNFVMSLLQPKPDIHVGVAFYAYEKAFLLTGETKTYHYEMRNLASNCRLWRAHVPLPKGWAKTPDPQSWVLSKFLLENVSSGAITNLRIGIISPLLKSTTELSITPNVQATGELDSSSNDALHTYVISIAPIAPMASAVFSLQTPIDDSLRPFLFGQGRKISASVPFVSADQFGTLRPKASKLNAMEMVKREAELRTGERTFADEKIEFQLLRPDEPNVKDEQVSYQLLPPAVVCPEGKGGDW